MNFLSIPAIDFDSLGSQHLIWVAPTTAQPKQPLPTQKNLHTALFRNKTFEINELP